MAIIYNNPAVKLASSMVSLVSSSPSKMMEVKLDHVIHAAFSFFLSFLIPKCWLSQWDSSGLFFPSVHPQKYTASSWPFLRVEGLNKTPLKDLPPWCSRDHGRQCVVFIFSVLPGFPFPILYQNLEFLHGSWAWPLLSLEKGIKILEGFEAREALEGL